MPTSPYNISVLPNQFTALQKSMLEGMEGARKAQDYSLDQTMRKLYSKNLKPDGSLDHYGMLDEASKSGVGPSAVKLWLDTVNATNQAASNQTATEDYLRATGRDPNALRNPDRIGETSSGTAIPKGQNSQYVQTPGEAPGEAPGATGTATADEIKANDALVAGMRSPSEVGPAKSGAGAFVPKTAPVTNLKQKLNTAAATVAPKDTASKIRAGLDALKDENQINGFVQGKSPAQIRAIQQVVGAKVDGVWGPNTKAKIAKYLKAQNTPVDGTVAITTPESKAPEGKLPAPEDTFTSSVQPDKRSILERLSDSYKGNNSPNGGAVDNTQYLDYSKVTKSGSTNYKAGIDAALKAKGLPEGQEGINRYLNNAALSVSVPVPTGSTPEAIAKFRADQAAYPALVAKAKMDAAKELYSAGVAGVGQEYAGQGNRRTSIEFAQQQDPIQDAIKHGYKVNSSNVADFLNAKRDLDNLNESRNVVHGLLKRDLTKMSDDDFISNVYNALQAYSKAEGIGSVSAAEKAEVGLRLSKGFWQSVKEDGLTKELLQSRLKNMGSQDKIEYLKQLSTRLAGAKQAEHNLNKYKGAGSSPVGHRASAKGR